MSAASSLRCSAARRRVVGIECNPCNLETILDPPSIPRKGTKRGAFLRRVLTICTSVINRCAPIVGIILAGLAGAFFLWFALSLFAFMGFLLPAPLPVLLLSSPPIFDNFFGWLGAIGLAGIGLAIAGAVDRTARKVFPILSSIWFGIAALSMCAWSIFIVGPPRMLPDVLLLYAVYGFLFGLVGLVFAAVCRWVLERKPQSIGVRVFSYASLFFYLILTAAYAWFASHPFPPFDALAWYLGGRLSRPSVHLATWALLMAQFVDAFILFDRRLDHFPEAHASGQGASARRHVRSWRKLT